MGVDFNWSGSSSYPRYNEELESLLNTVGITVIRQKGNWLVDTCPENTPLAVIRWVAHNKSEYFNKDDVNIIYSWLTKQKDYKSLAKKAFQIMHELKCSVRYGTGWCLS